jgi:hypothetical protein
MVAMTYFKNKTGFKRNYPRLNIDMLAYYQILVNGIYEKEVPLLLKTIGKGGLMFLSPIPLSIGKELQMRLLYYSKLIEFTAKGVWTEKIERRNRLMFKSGAIFTAISNDNLDYINHIVNIHTGNRAVFI